MITKLYAFKFLDGLLPILSIYLVLFSDRGLNPIQISTLLIISSIVYMACEIPSGALADTFSKRGLIVIGEVLRALGYTAFLVLPNYIGFGVGMVLWGVSSAFVSGAWQALAYDYLKDKGRQKQYVAVMGRASSIGLIARGTAAGLASLSMWLAGYWLVLAISSAAAVCAAVIAGFFPNPPSAEKTDKRYFKVMGRAFTEIWQKREALLAILVLAVLVTALGGFIEEYSQVFMAAAGIAKPLIPLLVLAIIIPPVLAGFVAGRFETLGMRASLVLLIATGGLLFLTGYSGNWFGIITLGAALFIGKLLMVILDGTMQHNIDSHSRVTIASVREACAELTIALLYLIYGLIATYRGAPAGYMALGVLVMFAGLVFVWVYNKKSSPS